MQLPYVTKKGVYNSPYFFTDYGSKIFLGYEYPSLKEAFIVFSKQYKVLKIIPIEKEPKTIL